MVGEEGIEMGKWKGEKKGVAEKLDMAYNLLVAEFAMWIGK